MQHAHDFAELTRVFKLIDPDLLTDAQRNSAAHFISMIDAFQNLGCGTPEMTELRAVLENLVSPPPSTSIH